MKHLIIDGHSDSIYHLTKEEGEYDFFKRNKEGHMDWVRMNEAGINLQIMGIFVEPQYKPYQALPRTLELCGIFHNFLDNNKNSLLLVKNKKDVTSLKEDNRRIGFLLGLEGGEALTSENILQSFFTLGVRLVGLTWNQRNQLADGVSERNTGGGLSSLGKKMVKRMNHLGVIVDVSHLSEAGFWDIVDTCKGPFVASHSNVYNLTNHPRNLKDDQIEALVKTGGIIGMNFNPPFLNKSKKAELSDVLAHTDYIVNKWGFANIGLGSDFDGIKTTPKGLEDISKLDNLKLALEKRYGEANTRKIMGDNWTRVLLDVLPET